MAIEYVEGEDGHGDGRRAAQGSDGDSQYFTMVIQPARRRLNALSLVGQSLGAQIVELGSKRACLPKADEQ